MLFDEIFESGLWSIKNHLRKNILNQNFIIPWGKHTGDKISPPVILLGSGAEKNVSDKLYVLLVIESESALKSRTSFPI